MMGGVDVRVVHSALVPVAPNRFFAKSATLVAERLAANQGQHYRVP
jgi:hypothetical protein